MTFKAIVISLLLLIATLMVLVVVRGDIAVERKIDFRFVGSNPTPTPTVASYASDYSTNKTYKEELARHLTSVGAVMYGAYWCPHCKRQKTMFDDGFKDVTYVECDSQGEDANPQLCRSKAITAYPTWEINGRFHAGVLPLERLAKLSGFHSP